MRYIDILIYLILLICTMSFTNRKIHNMGFKCMGFKKRIKKGSGVVFFFVHYDLTSVPQSNDTLSDVREHLVESKNPFNFSVPLIVTWPRCETINERIWTPQNSFGSFVALFEKSSSHPFVRKGAILINRELRFKRHYISLAFLKILNVFKT